MAVTSLFSPATGLLAAFGDGLDDDVEIAFNAAGVLRVNRGAVPVGGGTPTVANTAQIQVFGQDGNDAVTLNERFGALPAASLSGGAGNDTLAGGAGSDTLLGQADNDALHGKAGFDLLFGGAGNDTLTGGDGDDQMFGEAGDDLLVWNPGDDTDLHEGGAGIDTTLVDAGEGSEVFAVTANGLRVRFDRLDPAPFSIDMGTMEQLVVEMNGGHDSFSATGNLAALVAITVDGGAGDDTILGSNGHDLLIGGAGKDFIDGQQGNDVVLLGAGNDVFQWDPGDGSDVVEGQAGVDTMLFNGSAGAEIMEASANGGRLRFTRNLGNIVMDLDDVEKLELNALGGVDVVTIGDLSGTDLVAVAVNLAGMLGGTIGDAQADSVSLRGTDGDEAVRVVGAGTSLAVIGLHTRVDVSNAEGANDALAVSALGGNDVLAAATLGAGVVKLTLDGGGGNDTMAGSQGDDVLIGGDGNDVVDGNQGNDVALLGAGDDLFRWDPGDGSDVVEGQDGTDTLRFFGSNASENINVVANGGRVLFLRDVANVVMDLNDIETIDYRALGGADNIVVGDLSGTDVTAVALHLRGPAGGGDGAADTVTVSATQGADTFGVSGDARGVQVFGLQARVDIFNPEGALDRLTLNGLGGDDVIDASSLQAGAVQLVMNGGLGADLFLGSAGGDLIVGGDGNDVALMGAGDDSFTWNPGDDNDVVEGQDGFDTLLFNGANIAETISIFANGGRVVFFRDIANVTMDLNDVEQTTFNALGGADTIVIGDLTGTDMQVIRINLAASGGGGDGQADTIVVNATSGDDVTLVVGDNGLVTVLGLSAVVEIVGFEAQDRVVINALGGNDVVDASGLASVLKLSADGGVGDDVLIGGDGNDTLLGGAGDDVLLGGPGIDVLDGGPDDNVVIQSVTTGVFGF